MAEEQHVNRSALAEVECARVRVTGGELREGTVPVAHHRALASTGGGGTQQDLDFNKITLVASLSRLLVLRQGQYGPQGTFLGCVN